MGYKNNNNKKHVKSSYTCCIEMFWGKTQRINLLRSWYQVCVYGYGIPPRTPTLKTQTPFTKDDGNKRKKRRLRRAGNTWNGNTCLKGRIVLHEMFWIYSKRDMFIESIIHRTIHQNTVSINIFICMSPALLSSYIVRKHYLNCHLAFKISVEEFSNQMI